MRGWKNNGIFYILPPSLAVRDLHTDELCLPVKLYYSLSQLGYYLHYDHDNHGWYNNDYSDFMIARLKNDCRNLP